jgi:hypothetical protein
MQYWSEVKHDRAKAKQTIEYMLDTKGMDWVIAAMIEGSIGYHGAKSAENAINWLMGGHEEGFSERCMACFGCDGLAEIYSDVAQFYNKESVRSRFNHMWVVIRTKHWNFNDQTMLGFALPTMGP